MSWIRSMMRDRRSFAPLIAGVAVTLSVVVGLFAMHTATPTEHSQESALTVAAGVAADVASSHSGALAGSTVFEHCDCGSLSSAPVHPMVMVACILALLATFLVLVPPAASRVTFGTLRRIAASRTAWARGAVALLRPPSLLVLSISRT